MLLKTIEIINEEVSIKKINKNFEEEKEKLEKKNQLIRKLLSENLKLKDDLEKNKKWSNFEELDKIKSEFKLLENKLHLKDQKINNFFENLEIMKHKNDNHKYKTLLLEKQNILKNTQNEIRQFAKTYKN